MSIEVDKSSLEFVKHVTKDRNVDETKEIYTEWSGTYDEAMIALGFNGPKLTAEKFAELGLDKDVRILDVGAGTGKLAAELIKRGYKTIDAVEPSDMVEKAKKDNLYVNYFDSYVKLGQPLPIEKGAYDVVIMSGMLCPGHIHHEDLLELARVVKRGGLLCWSSKVNGYYGNDVPKYSEDNIEKVMSKYVQDGVWKYFQKPQILEKYYSGTQILPGVFYCMKIL